MKKLLLSKIKPITSSVGEQLYVPDLTGIEGLAYSMATLPDGNAIVRIAGDPAKVALAAESSITELDTTGFKSHLRARMANPEPENVDVPDPEIDQIAQTLGIDTSARGDVQVPTVGERVLQEQEAHLMALISERFGLQKSYWDQEAAARGLRGADMDFKLKRGENDAHEFILSRIRQKLKAQKAMGGRPV